MSPQEHLAWLRREGRALLAAATNLDAPVPSCPGWRARDLVAHTGAVHRRVLAVLRIPSQRPSRIADYSPPGEAGGDQRLLHWCAEGLDELCATLEQTRPDTMAWSWAGGDRPVAFWFRRMAQETAMHRVDAELSQGVVPTVDPALAADGIDELFEEFLSGRRPMEDARGDSLALRCEDAAVRWTVTFRPEGLEVRRGIGAAAASLRGPAAALHLVLWNRLDADAVTVEGDRTLARYWREHVHI